MDNRQTLRYQAGQRGQLVMENYNAQLITNTLYPPLKIKYIGILENISDVVQIQYEETQQITDYKLYFRGAMATTIFTYANIGSVQAYLTNHPDLAESLDKPVSFIMRGNDEDAKGRAKDLLKVMSDNSTILTEITPANFTEMDSAIKDFVNIMNAPDAEIKKKKAQGTDPIPNLLNQFDKVKHKIGQLISSSFPDIYPTWEKETKVGRSSGTRKTSAVVTYIDSATGARLPKIKTTISIGNDSFTKLSSKKGYSRFLGLANGNYIITSENKNYVIDVKENVSIDKRNIMRLEIKMVKMTSSGMLKIFVYDKKTGQGLSGARIDIPTLNVYSLTDARGIFSKDKIAKGTYTGNVLFEDTKTGFTFATNGIDDLSLEFRMEKGE
jgi:hypothetical protein